MITASNEHIVFDWMFCFYFIHFVVNVISEKTEIMLINGYQESRLQVNDE